MPYPKGELDAPRTQIQIYKEDHEWLLTRQREVSFRRNQHVTMFDLVHELIKSVWIKEEGTG